MNSQSQLVTALSVLAVPSVVLAGPIDMVFGIESDVFVGDPVASERTASVVSNGDFVDTFAMRSSDPLGAASALPGYGETIRPRRTTRDTTPFGFDRLIPTLDPDGLQPRFDADADVLDLVPTPGALALVSIGGLGFVSRRA